MKMVACLMLLAALVTLAKSGTLQLNIYTIMILCLKYILYMSSCLSMHRRLFLTNNVKNGLKTVMKICFLYTL